MRCVYRSTIVKCYVEDFAVVRRIAETSEALCLSQRCLAMRLPLCTGRGSSVARFCLVRCVYRSTIVKCYVEDFAVVRRIAQTSEALCLSQRCLTMKLQIWKITK